MATTPNKGLSLQNVGDTGWGVVNNSQVITILDLNLGGRQTKTVAGVDITLTSTECENVYLTLSGVLSADINVIWPAANGGFFFVYNASTGAHTITAKPSGGAGVILPQAAWSPIFINPDAGTASLVAMPQVFSAQGDLVYRSASAVARLPAGTSGQFLQTQGAGADPVWASTPIPTLVPIANGGTGQTTATLAFTALSPQTTQGDLITDDGVNPIRLAIGTVNKQLASDGSNPFWAETMGQSNGMLNGTLVPSVSGNALTVALKTLAGNDPSASDPVWFFFRNATSATGNYVIRKVTAATSVVVASTKTLGTSSSNVPFRIWVVGVDTGSGVQLGVVNCRSGTTIFPLRDDLLYSPTATPGNSAQVIYTTSGQTTKPTRVIGYLDWGTGLTTAGTWASGPTKSQLFGPGVPLPNYVVQNVLSATTGSASGTTQIPNDNTIPQNTEGDQYMSQAIGSIAAPNLLMVSAQIGVISTSGSGNSVTMALFQDSTANALTTSTALANNPSNITIVDYAILAGATSPTTFKIRAGYSQSGTTMINNLFGGTANTFLSIREIMA